MLRQAIHCCRNFGTVSIVGVYGGFLDKIPFGSAINRGLTFRMAQTPVQHYLPILTLVEEGKIDPSFVITDRAPLEEGPGLYKKFRDKKGGCIKVVMRPGASVDWVPWPRARRPVCRSIPWKGEPAAKYPCRGMPRPLAPELDRKASVGVCKFPERSMKWIANT